MTLGDQIIDELARRQLRGAFFNYSGFRKLRNIDDLSSLADLLREYGYEVDFPSANAGEIVEQICAQQQARFQRRNGWLETFMIIDTVVWIVLGLVYLAAAITSAVLWPND